jgi:uncharacterized protein YlxW (UPF0749 family)
VGLVYDGSEAVSVEILGNTVDTTAAGLFFSGAATMLVFLVGVWLVSSKMSRARRKRAERNAAKREARESVKQLERERTALAAENERLSERLDTTSTATGETSVAAPADVDVRDHSTTAQPSTGRHT